MTRNYELECAVMEQERMRMEKEASKRVPNIPNIDGKRILFFAVQNAVCLETHNCPDAINHENFPSPVLLPNQSFVEQTIYRFK